MSTPESEDTSRPNGRERTDKSLRTERAKADQSLAQAKKRLERHADEIVSTSREEADDAKFRIRLESDNLREMDKADPGASKVDECLLQERKIADDALDAERRRVDHALEHERIQKQALEDEFLREERKETDRDLTSERSWTDKESLRATNVLAEEMKAHLATQASLTSRKELLAIVSHDLRNPLASISMAVDLLKSAMLNGTVQDIIEEYIDLIGRNANEARRLIDDLLDMERMAAGKVTLQVEPHDINEIIHYSFKTIRHQAPDKEITLRGNCSEVKAIVLCDRGRISQVLSNLTSNALKFTPSGGKVGLSVDCKKEEVQISVSDTGPGIPNDMHEKIFERFWQIGKKDRNGLGLGLYISKMIVEAHRGRIWVDSRLGEGSTFHFTLPVGSR